MPVRNSILGMLCLAILVGEGILTWRWLQQYENYEPLKIQTAYDVFDNGHPVYAQFTYAQTFKLDQPHEVTALLIPLGKPTGSSEVIAISLRQNGRDVVNWNTIAVPAGSSEVELSLPEPQSMQGEFELTLAAPATPPEHQEQAIRVFIETADANYPDGNYRIANNQKQGDIGLRIIARRRRWQALAAAWHERSAHRTAEAAMALAGGLLVAVLPLTLDGAVQGREPAGPVKK